MLHQYIHVDGKCKFLIYCRFCHKQAVSDQPICCNDCLGGYPGDERPAITCSNGFSRDPRGALYFDGQSGWDEYGVD